MITLKDFSLLSLGLSLSLSYSKKVLLFCKVFLLQGTLPKDPRTRLENRRKYRIHREFSGLVV